MTSSVAKNALIGDPTEGALIAAAIKVGLTQSRPRTREMLMLFFESECQYMAILCTKPRQDDFFYVKGSVRQFLKRCNSHAE